MNEEIIKKIDKIENLPTLPVLVTQLIKLLEDPKTTADDINKLASKDIVLTTKVLKLVNSAYYGFSKKISTLTQGIIILGFKTVKNLALSASVFEMFKETEYKYFNAEQFWLHSIAVGFAAQIIGKYINYPNKEELFIAGITHDIGKLIMIKYFPDDFNKVIAILQENQNKSFYEVENEVLKYNHTDIGGAVVEKWNFPMILVKAISSHHNLNEYKDYTISGIIHISDVLVKTNRIGFSGDYKLPEFNKELWEFLDLSSSNMKNILEEINNNSQKIKELLEISL